MILCSLKSSRASYRSSRPGEDHTTRVCTTALGILKSVDPYTRWNLELYFKLDYYIYITRSYQPCGSPSLQGRDEMLASWKAISVYFPISLSRTISTYL